MIEQRQPDAPTTSAHQNLSAETQALRAHARRIQEARGPYRSMTERLEAVREVERVTGQVILVDEDRETFIADLAASIARTSPALVREIRAQRATFDQQVMARRRDELAQYVSSLEAAYSEQPNDDCGVAPMD